MLPALLLGYITVLLFLGRRKAAPTMKAYRDGNRQLGFWTIFVMVTALWSSSLIVVEIDTAYQFGLSALWYGVSVAVMSILVAALIPWFRRHDYISNSNLLGRAFGRGVRRLSGLVIGGTFPIFALSNALAAAIFLQTALKWPLWLSLSITALMLIVSIQFSGMLSLAQLQGFNLFMVMMGLVYAVWKLGHQTPLPHHMVMNPRYWQLWGADHGLIPVWLGMNILNVVCAQAEIQTLAAARSIRHAQRATWLSTIWLAIIIGVSTWLGLRTRMLTPNVHMSGLEAFFHVILAHSSPLMIAMLGMAMWSLALMWCGPLLFSGAISVAGDVIGRSRSVNWLRLGLVLEGIAMVLYGLWRPDQLAWWRVFGLTLRNAAVVGPTLALLLWKDTISPRSVLAAMVSGIVVGLGLNAITGFSASHFIWGINPMWSAATTSMVVLATARLLQRSLVLTIGSFSGWGFLMSSLIRYRLFPHILGIIVLLLGFVYVFYTWLATRQHQKSALRLLRPLPKPIEPD